MPTIIRVLLRWQLHRLERQIRREYDPRLSRRIDAVTAALDDLAAL